MRRGDGSGASIDAVRLSLDQTRIPLPVITYISRENAIARSDPDTVTTARSDENISERAVAYRCGTAETAQMGR